MHGHVISTPLGFGMKLSWKLQRLRDGTYLCYNIQELSTVFTADVWNKENRLNSKVHLEFALTSSISQFATPCNAFNSERKITHYCGNIWYFLEIWIAKTKGNTLPIIMGTMQDKSINATVYTSLTTLSLFCKHVFCGVALSYNLSPLFPSFYQDLL